MKHHKMRTTPVLLLIAAQNEMWQDSVTVLVSDKLLFLFTRKKLWKSAEFWNGFLTGRSARMLSKSLWYKDKWFGGNSYIKENRIAVHYQQGGYSHVKVECLKEELTDTLRFSVLEQ